ALRGGVAVCVPAACAQGSELLKSAIEYIAYAVGFGDTAVWLPAPRENVDITLLALYSNWKVAPVAVSEGAAEPDAEAFGGGCIVGRVPASAQLCWSGAANNVLLQEHKEEAACSPGSKKVEDLLRFLRRLPSNRRPAWLLCEESAQHEVWHGWVQDLQSGCRLGRALEIIERFAKSAWFWMATVYLHSFDLCESDHIPVHWRWYGDDFCSYHFFRDGRSPTWSGRRCWNRWGLFCPFGFAAALVVRAQALLALRYHAEAHEDLRMASAMLGSCHEFQLLPELWRGEDLSHQLANLEIPGDVDAFAAASAAKHFAIWHALQLNSLVRKRLEDVTRTQVSPKMVMMAYPSYLSLLWIPALMHLWPDLQLSLFRLGRWMDHEKCPSCAQHYQQHFLKEDPSLELPLDFSQQPAGNVVWSESLTHEHFMGRLQAWDASHPAEVILCAAPLWLCISLLMANAYRTGFVGLCLMRHDLGKPPDFHVKLAMRKLEDVVGHLQAFLHGSPLRRLWVREDMARAYGNFELQELPNFHPFVWLPSLYINDRHSECHDAADVVVMREGSLGRFAPTVHGHLFFGLLAQMVPSSGWNSATPWRLRLLPYSRERLSYQRLAAHRAAVFVPAVWYGKLTFKDLITMEIPLFMPDLHLQESISARHPLWGCGRWELGRIFCTSVRVSHRLPQSSFFRHPHVQRFRSAVDLVYQLASLDCFALEKISAQMKTWNAMLLKEDLDFWSGALQALATPKAAAPSEVEFSLPELPSPDCGDPLAAHCSGLKDSEGELTEEACCAEASATSWRARKLQEAVLAPGSDRASCLTDVRHCSEDQLLYAMHLLHDMPL
ncbi:unnamed protein product, partial [Effrenium voratum]